MIITSKTKINPIREKGKHYKNYIVCIVYARVIKVPDNKLITLLIIIPICKTSRLMFDVFNMSKGMWFIIINNCTKSYCL